MKFFSKRPESEIPRRGLSYDRRSDRAQIRDLLSAEQEGFCAYSEKVLMPLDSKHIEHYDPRLKSTPRDGYENWYLVLGWMNEHKPKRLDERFLPLIERPHEVDLGSRIRYIAGFFEPTNPEDIEANNFLEFIGVNRPEVVKERVFHVERITQVLNHVYGGDFDQFSQQVLLLDRGNFHFITALEVELDRPLLPLAREARHPSASTDKSASL
jgi:hypothetical protein